MKIKNILLFILSLPFVYACLILIVMLLTGIHENLGGFGSKYTIREANKRYEELLRHKCIEPVYVIDCPNNHGEFRKGVME